MMDKCQNAKMAINYWKKERKMAIWHRQETLDKTGKVEAEGGPTAPD